jgi:hypothetical protein
VTVTGVIAIVIIRSTTIIFVRVTAILITRFNAILILPMIAFGIIIFTTAACFPRPFALYFPLAATI